MLERNHVLSSKISGSFFVFRHSTKSFACLLYTSYIGLMRIRYTDAVDIRVEYPHDLPPQVSIPPLLLIVFVENAFKHGVSYSKPSFIHMRIDYADGKVVSTIGNSLHSPQAEKHNAGIGLENVRKRLSLIYGPKNYSLDIEETKETYTVKLVIPTLNA